MRGWLSRQHNGNYMLTAYKPVKSKVGKTDVEDFYVIPGDYIGFRNMCPWAAKAIWDAELEILQSVKVEFSGKIGE